MTTPISDADLAKLQELAERVLTAIGYFEMREALEWAFNNLAAGAAYQARRGDDPFKIIQIINQAALKKEE